MQAENGIEICRYCQIWTTFSNRTLVTNRSLLGSLLDYIIRVQVLKLTTQTDVSHLRGAREEDLNCDAKVMNWKNNPRVISGTLE